jgi:hypothetical protein
MIDEHFFGGEAVFRSTYVLGNGARDNLSFLRKRLQLICKRTLRRQVQETGLINYTARNDQPPFLSPGIKLGMGGVTVG